MGTCYTVWIQDEYNWDYVLGEKHKLKKDIKKAIPHCEFVADFYGWLIFDIDKTFPFDGKLDFIKCDHILISSDNDKMVPTKL